MFFFCCRSPEQVAADLLKGCRCPSRFYRRINNRITLHSFLFVSDSLAYHKIVTHHATGTQLSQCNRKVLNWKLRTCSFMFLVFNTRSMFCWFFLTTLAIPASHAFDASFSVDLALQVVNPLSLIIAISIFLICKKSTHSSPTFPICAPRCGTAGKSTR